MDLSPPEGKTLTAREREAATLVAEGLPNKLVADRMGISFHTARFHIGNAMKKLGASNRTQVAVFALQLGLIPHAST